MDSIYESIFRGEVFLVLLLNVLAIYILYSNNLLNIIFALSFFSIILTLIHVIMAAPDVALTEASIGVFLSTAFLLMCLPCIENKKEDDVINNYKLLLGVIISFPMSYMLALYLPNYGDPNTNAYLGISAYYLENNLNEIGINSVVAGILASYRGFDTLGETLVITIAGIIVYFICDQPFKAQQSKKNPIMLEFFIKLISPIILLFAFYIQVFGEVSPGGGFQSGSIAATFVFFYIYLKKQETELLKNLLIKTSVMGFLIYLLTGFACMIKGGSYLEYDAFNLGRNSHKLGIFLIESGVALTVFSVMLLIAIILKEKNDFCVRN